MLKYTQTQRHTHTCTHTYTSFCAPTCHQWRSVNGSWGKWNSLLCSKDTLSNKWPCQESDAMVLINLALKFHFKKKVKNRPVMTNTKEIHFIKYAWKHPFEQVVDSRISHRKPPSPPTPLFHLCELTSVFSKKDETSPHHAALGSIHLLFHLTFWFISIIFYLFWTAAEAFIFQIHCGALVWSSPAFTTDCHIHQESNAQKSRLLLVFIELVTYFGWSLTHTHTRKSVSAICCSNPITGPAIFVHSWLWRRYLYYFHPQT